ncbi:MAG: hypothetical protein IJ301_02705 [Clostridia bacterium]|nr:hypothetical protein [Clostridia bacterium]
MGKVELFYVPRVATIDNFPSDMEGMTRPIYVYTMLNVLEPLGIREITHNNLHHVIDGLLGFRTFYSMFGNLHMVNNVNYCLDMLVECLPDIPGNNKYRYRNEDYNAEEVTSDCIEYIARGVRKHKIRLKSDSDIIKSITYSNMTPHFTLEQFRAMGTTIKSVPLNSPNAKNESSTKSEILQTINKRIAQEYGKSNEKIEKVKTPNQIKSANLNIDKSKAHISPAILELLDKTRGNKQ